VILLMLRLGLRAKEVATLCLDDLDWRAGEITVHGKGGRLDQLPLPWMLAKPSPRTSAAGARAKPRCGKSSWVSSRLRSP
jgi:integrase